MKLPALRPLAALTVVSYFCAAMPGSTALAAGAAQPGKPNAPYSLVEDTGELKGAEFVMRQYPGEKLMAVRLLSGVKNPGIYYVPEGTDMLTAISLAGGLLPTADPNKVRWNKWSTQKHQILDLEDVVAEPKSRNPALGPNDVVMIDEEKPLISANTMLVLAVITSVVGIAVGAKALSTK